MNGTTASEKLGLGSEVRELKFGSSFSGKGGGSFHTIRYDFKPASVDATKTADLEVEKDQVTISIPHADGHTKNVFAGPRKPYSKECVLMIDPETGEVVLQRLTHSIQVKKTRQEGGGRMSRNGAAAQPPPASVPLQTLPKSTPSLTSSNSSTVSNARHPIAQSSSSSSYDRPTKTVASKSSAGSVSASSSNRRPQSPSLNVPQSRSSPMGRSPNMSPPGGGNAFDSLLSQHSKQQKEKPPSSTLPSLSNFEDLLMTGPSASVLSSSCSSTSSILSGTSIPDKPMPSIKTSSVSSRPPTAPAILPSAVLSDSSSSSSSSGSSSEESSDEDMEVVPEPRTIPPMHQHNSMPSMPMIPGFMGGGLGHSTPPSSGSAPSRGMPSHLLSEDLQLSESGSDSD